MLVARLSPPPYRPPFAAFRRNSPPYAIEKLRYATEKENYANSNNIHSRWEWAGMDTLGAIRVFSRVVEAGSFSAVARELGTTQPTISKQIAMLVNHLGTRVNRTPRNLTPTEDGKTSDECCRHILQTVEEADGAVGRR